MAYITLAELRTHYELAMQQYRGLNARQAVFAGRRACEIGRLLSDAGCGVPPRAPEDTQENLSVAATCGIARIELPAGWLESMRWK